MGALFLHRRTSSPAATSGGTTPLPDLMLDENDAAVVYGGTVGEQTFVDYYDGHGKYVAGMGDYLQVTVPTGYTRLVFEGILNAAGATFDVSVNGTPVGSGSQTTGANDGANHTVYYDLTGLVAGDVVRFTKTGGGVLFSDRYRFKAS